MVVVVGAEVVVDPAAAAPALAVVVVAALAVVVVVACACGCESSVFGACASATSTNAFWTFVLTAFCWSWLSLFMSDCTLIVCWPPRPSSCTVGSMTPVPFNASVAWD